MSDHDFAKLAMERKPEEFRQAVEEKMKEFVRNTIADKRIEVARKMFNKEDDGE